MSWPLLRRSSPEDAAPGHRGQPCREASLPPGQPTELGDEAEAFVQGRLVDHLHGAGRPVPAWAVLNRLAHASVDELTELATGAAAPGASSPEEPAWLAAQRSLAAELVRGAARPEDVVAVQRAVLVPLELWAIRRSRSEAVTSRRIVELAMATLADHRATG